MLYYKLQLPVGQTVNQQSACATQHAILQAAKHCQVIASFVQHA